MDCNPEIDQDRVFDVYDHFNRFGRVMFPQQEKIYVNIAETIKGRGLSVLEAGCGNGVGSANLERESRHFMATDKSLRNIDFAHQLYPWIDFREWDINQPFQMHFTAYTVVCIETIEHVANPEQAIRNLLDVARESLWLSTPNGLGKRRPPENPHHVCEYTVEEMLEMIGDHEVTVLHWDTMDRLGGATKVDPLIYHIRK